MPFDQSTRNLLQRTVSACRTHLDTEFAAQRRSIYGINDDGTVAPWETLSHLSDEDTQIAHLLRDRLDHLVAGLESQGKKPAEARQEAVGRLTREQAFTVLNRLAALRMAEEREIVLECVRKGTTSEGFELFMQSAGSALGSKFESYRAYLFLLFDEVALDLGVLFSRWDPAGLLFPRQEALEAVLEELSGTGKANKNQEFDPAQFSAIWSEDEAIGWIYQYYNDQAERKKMREESAAPRNSRELAVRNQFFTPRYVVEFLTDNTLGRIWYEMTQGDTKLKEQCRYLVRRPTEIFLQPGENPPALLSTLNPQPSTAPTQEELLKQPVHIPHRPLKDPRTILMLDPACGSMHFGLYAFDLFEVIYDEAWALEEKLGAAALSRPPGMKSLHATYAGKDAFLKDVPRLIIEHNIHGIDIDPRCAQIAGLALWLRAQKAWQRLDLEQAKRPVIKRSNIVCAEPMPGEKVLLREFVEREFPVAERAVCLRLLEAIFDKMQLAGEAGSLLKIEEEIRSAIEDARGDWEKIGEHLPGLAADNPTSDPRPLTTDFWERIEERIYAALRDYAEQAENGGGFQRRLFAEDAARGFAFIDVCRKRYDAAVMNPPFGEYQELTRQYYVANYPSSRNDLIGMFIERCLDICPGGAVGVISSRTLFFLTTFDALRVNRFMADDPPVLVVDLGKDVMDNAMVEAAAYCIFSGSQTSPDSVFIRALNPDTRPEVLDQSIAGLAQGLSPKDLYIRNVKLFSSLENSPFCYWAAPPIVELFEKCERLDTETRKVRVGLQTGDDFRYIRCRWENSETGNWVPHPKGGETVRFAADVHLCVNWAANGAEIRSDPRARVQNEPFYFSPGITSSYRCLYYSPALFPSGMITGVAGSAIYCSPKDAWWLMGLGNSRAFDALIKLRLGSSEAGIIQVGHLQASPVPEPSAATKAQIEALAREGWNSQVQLFRQQETSGYFVGGTCRAEIESNRFDTILRNIDAAAAAAYGIPEADFIVVSGGQSKSKKDEGENADSNANEVDITSYLMGLAFGRWDIQYATGEQPAPELPDPFAPLPVCPPGQLQNAQGLPARPEDVPAAYPVRIPWDGILVDDPNHPLDLERRVREVIEIIWSGQEGGPTAEAIEHEACEILGVKSLRDYFRKPAGFFADHLKRYSKSRRQAPIYWPLSTASGSYTLWIYYHRLTPDTLYKCLQQFVEPKIKDVEQEIHHLRTVLATDEAGTKERKQLADAETLLNELKDLHAELTLWAPKWKPNLNDGVLITASPLWKLFRLPKWQKALETCWKELNKGDYDWAHLALTLRPNEVREKCKSDRSLAIAHNLEDLCEIKAPEPKAKRAAKKVSGKKTAKKNSSGEAELL